MFDNGQVIGKTWQLSPLSTLPTSVVTVHAQIGLGFKNLQWEEQHKPKYWWFKNFELIESADENLFRSFRNEFIECRLGKLTKNSADVDEMVEKRKWFEEVKFCSNQECRRENSKSFRKCRSCGDSLIS